MSKKILIFITLIFLIFPEIGMSLSVGFENLRINPGVTKTASYVFGDHAMIFCFETDDRGGVKIRWTSRGNIRESILPILLKTKGTVFEGKRADPSGNLKITNPRKNPVFVSCVFGF